ncbi:hypothetical protein RND81_04G008100 [Saponaria officinalis]|uniref:SHSP domain-containing protein n=1 Tax=Saponaria officinalis TaxID=3572 RepID=A0AAW1LGJ4_SAPOF
MIPNDDCYFLLYFIMGTYFGPDLKGERVKRSVLQRVAEGLPPYTLEQLAGSHIKISEIEQIYYYLLRKANKSVVVKVPLLHQFIEGDFPSQHGDSNRPQFPALFPPHLHPKMEYFNQSIANVTYIRKPAVFYIKQEDIEKFKRLTGLENLFVETNVEKRIPGDKFPVKNKDSNDKSPTKKNADKDSEDKVPVKKNGDKGTNDVPIVRYYRGSQRKRRLTEMLQTEKPAHCNGASKSSELAPVHSRDKDFKPEMKHGPGIVILTTEPSRQELDSIVDIARNAYALTGSAAKGIVGSVIGLMDMGESEDSYLFRVALPGVKRENRAFQCEVESDGRVLIKGETVTGEKTVNRYSQEFVMQSRNLCPPGPFSISFQLPGPVDPQQFSGTFGTNAILEGIVMKQKTSRPIIADTPIADTPTPDTSTPTVLSSEAPQDTSTPAMPSSKPPQDTSPITLTAAADTCNI